jgi:hypothetical protein
VCGIPLRERLHPGLDTVFSAKVEIKLFFNEAENNFSKITVVHLKNRSNVWIMQRFDVTGFLHEFSATIFLYLKKNCHFESVA